jgi:hypothetical protein
MKFNDLSIRDKIVVAVVFLTILAFAFLLATVGFGKSSLYEKPEPLITKIAPPTD